MKYFWSFFIIFIISFSWAVYFLQLHEFILVLIATSNFKKIQIILLLFIFVGLSFFLKKFLFGLFSLLSITVMLNVVKLLDKNVIPSLYHEPDASIVEITNRGRVKLTNLHVYEIIHEFKGALYVPEFNLVFFGLTPERLGLFAWQSTITFLDHDVNLQGNYQSAQMDSVNLTTGGKFFYSKETSEYAKCLIPHNKDLFFVDETHQACSEIIKSTGRNS